MGFGGGWGGGRSSGSTGGGGGGSDTVPPVLADYNPPLGTAIPRTGTVQFSVTDDQALRRVIVVAAYAATGIDELVFDGDGFRGAYASRSRRETIAGGYRYTVGRSAGGFPSAPRFQVFAVDTSGNENI